MDNRSPYPPVPNARAIMEQEGSTEERVFLQYQFHQQTQTTLNEKWIFVFSKKIFFTDAKTPRKQLKGNPFTFLNLPLQPDVWLFPTDVPISEQRVGAQAGSILLLLLLGTGKTGTASAGDGSTEGLWWGWGLSPP